MSRPRPSAHRRAHRTQSGFTLIELLVSLALLAIIGGVVAAAFSVGLKALGPGGAGDRLSGASDQMMFEQALGKDVARGACLQVSGGTKYGSCSAGFANATITGTCGSALLCVGWPQGSGAVWSCHVAAYTSASAKVTRTEYAVASGGGSASQAAKIGLTTDTVTVTAAVLATAPTSYPWVARLSVAVKNTGVTLGQPTDTLVLEPLASDPDGTGAAVEGLTC